MLQDAVAELRAAPAIGDIANWRGRMRPLNRSDELMFQFGGSLEIVFSVNHVRRPVSASGDLVWEKVSSIQILKVETKNAEHN